MVIDRTNQHWTQWVRSARGVGSIVGFLEFDIKGLFDNIPWDLLNKAVQHHITEKWVLLYIDRWLKAPMELEGKDQPRTKGTPQGSVVSPRAEQFISSLRV